MLVKKSVPRRSVGRMCQLRCQRTLYRLIDSVKTDKLTELMVYRFYIEFHFRVLFGDIDDGMTKIPRRWSSRLLTYIPVGGTQ